MLPSVNSFLRDRPASKANLKDFLDWYFQDERLPVLGAASMSDYAENAVLNHITGKSAMSAPSVSLSLTTVVPTDASTGATITEANYTGFARQALAAGAWNSASGGSITNSGLITFGNCTAGSSTVIGWALLDSGTLGAGNIIVWGTTTSVVISTTQTPPTIAAGALQINLD